MKMLTATVAGKAKVDAQTGNVWIPVAVDDDRTEDSLVVLISRPYRRDMVAGELPASELHHLASDVLNSALDVVGDGSYSPPAERVLSLMNDDTAQEFVFAQGYQITRPAPEP